LIWSNHYVAGDLTGTAAASGNTASTGYDDQALKGECALQRQMACNDQYAAAIALAMTKRYIAIAKCYAAA